MFQTMPKPIGGGSTTEYEVVYAQDLCYVNTQLSVPTTKKARGIIYTSVSGWGAYQTWYSFDQGKTAYCDNLGGQHNSVTVTFNDNNITFDVTAGGQFRYAALILY